MHKNRITLYSSIILFVFGLGCIFIYYVSTNHYNNAYVSNYLPPAGDFIKGKKEFSFAVIGDSGLRDEPLQEIVTEIKKKQYSFILDLGDQARKLILSNFELLLQTNNRIIGNYPFYSVPGNHDITNETNADHLRFYKRAFGQPYYWFTYGNTLFIGLDTSKGTLPLEQKKWLVKILSKLRSSYKTCIIYMHVPPIDPRHNQHYSMRRDVAALRNITSKYKVTTIFAGHIHEFNKSKFGGANLYICPPSGQVMRGKTKKFGYLGCSVNRNGTVNVKNIPVTSNRNRDYFRYYLSTEAQLYPIFIIGVICIILSWLTAIFRKKQ